MAALRLTAAQAAERVDRSAPPGGRGRRCATCPLACAPQAGDSPKKILAAKRDKKVEGFSLCAASTNDSRKPKRQFQHAYVGAHTAAVAA